MVGCSSLFVFVCVCALMRCCCRVLFDVVYCGLSLFLFIGCFWFVVRYCSLLLMVGYCCCLLWLLLFVVVRCCSLLFVLGCCCALLIDVVC